MTTCITAMVLALIGVGNQPPAATSATSPKLSEMTLRDFRGAAHSLGDLVGKQPVVVAFLGVECPLAKLYGPKLEQMAKELRAKGVAVIAVDSNQQDLVTEMAHYAKVHGLTIPFLKDVGNQLADLLGATRTPEVVLLDAKGAVVYRGRIDDQYGIGYQRKAPTRRELVDAIEQLLANKPIAVAKTEAPGCLIGKVRQPKPNATVTYSSHIAKIFQDRCVACHRQGQIAPFALTSYQEAAGWAETIREVVREQRMPPWHADPKYGHFSNDARLSDSEKQLIEQWVKAGAPEGNPKDLPPARKFTEGWQIPTPDLVVQMPKEFTVKAEGTVAYQYFVVDPGFTEDKFVQYAECRPGNRSVVHHIILLVHPPDNFDDPNGLRSDWLTATAPGAKPLALPDGYGKRIPAGSKLIFQMHYTPNGSVQIDRSSVGLKFADPKSVKQEVYTRRAAMERFRIPPNTADHVVTANHRFNQDTTMLAMFPHMHLRGKAFRYEATYPDGRREVLLDVPRYDFGWQNAYVLAEPKKFPKGTTIQCTAHFDNSESNLNNPNPNVAVFWGDQTWQEMMIGYFDVVPAHQDLSAPPPKTRTAQFAELAAKTPPTVDDEIKSLTAGSLRAADAFTKLAAALQKKVPQLDWVCLATVDKDQMRIEQSAKLGQYRGFVPGAGFERPAAGFAIASYVAGDKTVVHADLSKATGLDLRTMNNVFRSSLHVPVRVGDKRMLVSFFSRERDGFPQPAVEFFKAAVAILAK